MAIRTANAEWNGTLTGGNGSMETGSGAIQGAYSFESRFKEGPGTNPEELIAAAHAGCFSMAFSGELGNRGAEPESVRTEAKVQVLKVDDGFAVTRIDLTTVVRASGIDEATFQDAAQAAKAGCPISRALAAVPEINLDARLES